ncbi:MAG: N-6 DNA methylase, partial [candidate division Zixibacteria bacterium]|nr:N-6 DNA methylase [candidate division Zixibacteria bacterium]
TKITLYGQEKDSATSGLARMNMILHDNEIALIEQGNTLANPLFLNDNGALKTFDYVVANPPFSDKRWGNGVDAVGDIHGRFKDFGIPPSKNGDYAYLLHIIRSLKSKAKGACILPHGVLFRGNAEAEIRTNIIRRGYIKGIIGLPANLFYGTGIPACIIVLDKENAHNRKGIFMIDASKGYMKDGPKNRLRSMDIHKIVEVFNKQLEIDKYSKMIPFAAIEKNEYNLNIPRYIDSQEPEDIQDIEAHLLGDIPNADIDALENYWMVYPTLKTTLFGKSKRAKYSKLKVEKDLIKQTIFEHPEFAAFAKKMNALFTKWKKKSAGCLKALQAGAKPKEVIFDLSESLLAQYTGKKLIDKYDVYQHLMNYWDEVMQDDCYIIAVDGWKAETYRILVENKKKKMVDKGWTCDLIPKELVINRFFVEDKQAIEALAAESETIAGKLTELEEEHSGEDGVFAELDKVSKGNAQKLLKELKNETDAKKEIKIVETYLDLIKKQAVAKKQIKEAQADLDNKLYAKYPALSEDEIKTLVVDDKWMTAMEKEIRTEMDRISQRLTQRVKELAERYETPLPIQTTEVSKLEKRVNAHLKKMGFSWK